MVITSLLALLLTFYATPRYDGETLDRADALASEDRLEEALLQLYSSSKSSKSSKSSESSESSETEV